MSAGVADILCITQITFIIVHYALLANYSWFWLAYLDVFVYFATLEHGLNLSLKYYTLLGVDHMAFRWGGIRAILKTDPASKIHGHDD